MTFRVEVRDPQDGGNDRWHSNWSLWQPSTMKDDFTSPPVPVPTRVSPHDGFPWSSTYSNEGGSFPFNSPSTSFVSAAKETAPSESTGQSAYPTVLGSTSSSTPLPSTIPQHENSPPDSTTITHVAAAVIPLACLAILGVVLFFYLRRRRDKKRQASFAQQEMKSDNRGAFLPSSQQRAYYHPPQGSPPPALSPMPPAPVIIGPIAPNSNGAYYTGIDTSDVVSMHEQPQTTGLGNPFVDPVHEEPPPPYRPRSLAPVSRNASLRSPPPAALSQTNLIAAQEQSRQSPFRDPHDDDNISEFSEPTGAHCGRRAVDEMSAVSDLSYQQDPVIVRPSV